MHRDLSARLFYKMKRENIELTRDVTQALDHIDFDHTQGKNREYVKDLQVISKYCAIMVYEEFMIGAGGDMLWGFVNAVFVWVGSLERVLGGREMGIVKMIWWCREWMQRYCG